MADFPLARYERVHATPDEIAKAERRFAKMSADQQDAFVRRIEIGSDYELAEELDAHRDHAEPDEDAVPDPDNPAKTAGKRTRPSVSDPGEQTPDDNPTV